MNNSSALCSAATACPPIAHPWLHHLQDVLRKALSPRPGRVSPPNDLDLLSLAHLSEATLKDIGVPEGVRHYAAQQREQADLLRHIEAHHGGTNPSRW